MPSKRLTGGRAKQQQQQQHQQSGLQDWLAHHVVPLQRSIRGIWTAAVVWLSLLLLLEVLITGKVPAWLKSATYTSSTLWLSWIAVGTLSWLASEYLAGMRQAVPLERQTSETLMAELLMGSVSGTGDKYSPRTAIADHSTLYNTSSCPSPNNQSSQRGSLEATCYAAAASTYGNGQQQEQSLQKQLVGSNPCSALNTVAGLRPSNHSRSGNGGSINSSSVGAAARSSCMRRLRRLSLRHPNQAYSEAPTHAGTVMVLYVDNSPIDQAVLSVLLGNEPGFKLVCASSGQQALELVFGAQWLPDIVLMDVLLPDMKTSELCSQVRSMYSPVELPIVLLSSRSGEADMLAALEGGVNDFLIKPLRRLELMARINSQMMIKHSVRREAESRSHYELLVQVLPPHIIQQLAAGHAYIPEKHEEVTILFSDIVGFTELCALWPTQEVVAMLDMMFSSFDDLCDRHAVFKVETIGDAYMIVAGHDGSADHALRMASMAVDMLAAAEDIQQQLTAQGRDGRHVQIRIGMHTGPAHSGVVGKRRPRYCFFGDTVNTASRMESSGHAMTVHLSDACARSMTAAATRAVLESSSAAGACGAAPAAAAAVAVGGGGSGVLGGGGSSSALPWDLLDLGVQHVKGKGRMRTLLLKAGDWHAALCAQRSMQMQHGHEQYAGSSTCSTGSPVSPPRQESSSGFFAHSVERTSHSFSQDQSSQSLVRFSHSSGSDATAQPLAQVALLQEGVGGMPSQAYPSTPVLSQLLDTLGPRRASSVSIQGL